MYLSLTTKGLIAIGFAAAVILALFGMLPSFILSKAFALSSPPTLKLSSPLLALPYSPTGTVIQASQQVIISTTVSHNFGDKETSFITFLEVRNKDGATEYLAWQSGEVKVGGQTEVGVSWIPERAGEYEIRTFAVSDLANPQVLSSVSSSEVRVGKENSGTFSVAFRDRTFDISYQYLSEEGGKAEILTMEVIPQDIGINATVNVTEDSTLDIHFPKEMLKQLEVSSGMHYCVGNEFAAFVDGKDVVIETKVTEEEEIQSIFLEKGSTEPYLAGSDLLMGATCNWR